MWFSVFLKCIEAPLLFPTLKIHAGCYNPRAQPCARTSMKALCFSHIIIIKKNHAKAFNAQEPSQFSQIYLSNTVSWQRLRCFKLRIMSQNNCGTKLSLIVSSRFWICFNSLFQLENERGVQIKFASIATENSMVPIIFLSAEREDIYLQGQPILY